LETAVKEVRAGDQGGEKAYWRFVQGLQDGNYSFPFLMIFVVS